jgi:hypothetical protein
LKDTGRALATESFGIEKETVSMSSRVYLGLVVVVMVVLVGACQEGTRRLHAPPQGPSDKPHPIQDDLVYMADNAKLSDMCVVDIHFVPHTSFLSGTGERCLNRYAELLMRIGGTIHYEPSVDIESELVDARVQSIEAFLADAGLDMAKVEVKAGLNRGRRSPATDSIDDKLKGTNPQQQQQGGGYPAFFPQ